MKNILRILAYVRPYWHFQLLYICFSLVYAGSLLAFPWLEKLLIDDVLTAGNADMLLPLCSLYLLIAVGLFFITFCMRYFGTKVSQNVSKDIKLDAYHHLRKLGFHFYDSQQTGRTMALFNSDIPKAAGLRGFIGGYLLRCIEFISTFCLVMSFRWQLGLFALLLVGLNLLIPILLDKPLKRIGTEIQEHRATLSAILQEGIAGSGELKGLGKELFDLKNIQQSLLRLVSLNIKQLIIRKIGSINVVLFWAAHALILFVGGGYVLRQMMTVGTLIASTRYFGSLYNPLRWIIDYHIGVPLSLVAARRVFAFFDEYAEEPQDGTPIADVTGYVRFSNVSFQYREKHPVLKAVSFEAMPGETVAIVGHSGAGKSTLIRLIPRFYQPQQGGIFIDTIPIDKIQLQSLRSHIGLVFQDPYLFADTVAYNIRIGAEAPEAVTLDEVATAAKLANAHDFIMNLPEQYESKVGERGVRLSGGERQRLAIARLFLRNPKILILDEATSSLDAESEALVQEALTQLIKGRTCFVIAHRLSTILNADKILVLNDGRLVETGTHSTLIQQQGVYHRLFQAQFAKMKV